jgi:hypothetical protein
VALAAWFGASASPAAAKDVPPPDELAAVDAYRETIPTARGPKPATQSPDTPVPRLSAGIERKVRTQGGADRKTLAQVAASPALGAPPLRPRAVDLRDRPEPASPSAAAAVTSTVSHERSRLIVLLVALLGVTAWGVATALLGRRRPPVE